MLILDYQADEMSVVKKFGCDIARGLVLRGISARRANERTNAFLDSHTEGAKAPIVLLCAI